MRREFLLSGQFSIVTARWARVPEHFPGSPLELSRSNPPQMKSFSGDSAAAKPDCSCMENMHQPLWSHSHTLASQTGERPPEEVEIVPFLGSTIRYWPFQISCFPFCLIWNMELFLSSFVSAATEIQPWCAWCFPTRKLPSGLIWRLNKSQQDLNYMFNIVKYGLYSLSHQDFTSLLHLFLAQMCFP